MEEYWGVSKEKLIDNLGEPHQQNNDEDHGIEEVTYFYPPEKDFQPEKEVTYGFVNNRLAMISTGFNFRENLFKQFEIYHDNLKKGWNEKMDAEPTKDTFEDEHGNKVTIWNKNDTEVVLFFNNDPAGPMLVTVQKFQPQSS